MVDDDDDDAIFVTKEWVKEKLGISLAEQERKRADPDDTFPGLVVLGDDPWDPQARVAYFKKPMLDWAFSRPSRPLKVKHDDGSRIVPSTKPKRPKASKPTAAPLKGRNGSTPV